MKKNLFPFGFSDSRTLIVQIVLALCLVYPYGLYAQDKLNFENDHLRFIVNKEGPLLSNFFNGEPGLTTGGGDNLIYAMDVMYSAMTNNNLKGFMAYYEPDQILNGGTINIKASSRYDSLFIVRAEEINNHKANFQNPGYLVPRSILNWPAQGDTGIGESLDMAPFVDFNNNGKYDPIEGDYPNIIGDLGGFLVKNDKGLGRGNAAGIEFHYQFNFFDSRGDTLDQTAVISIKAINKSELVLDNFRLAAWIDVDLGDANDDFVATSEEFSGASIYNASDFDSQYSNKIPGLAVSKLFCDLQGAGGILNAGYQAKHLLSSHNWLNHLWDDGSCWVDTLYGYRDPFTYGGEPTTYLFHGNPFNPAEWNETTGGTSPGDRVMGLINPPITFYPDSQIVISYGITYVPNTEGVPQSEVFDKPFQLKEQLEAYLLNNHATHPSVLSAQNCGEVQEPDCQTTSITELDANDFVLYPNPSKGLIRVDTHYPLDTYEVYDSSGKLQKAGSFSANTNLEIDLRSLDAGLYYIRLFGKDGKSVSKAISLN